MSNLKFKSSLTLEEIDKNFDDIDFFDSLMEGLEEAVAYSKGKAATETFIRKRSLPLVDVTEIRESLKLTQKKFADVLGVSPRTVEAWECGKTNPTPTAKKLMYLIKEDNTLVNKLL